MINTLPLEVDYTAHNSLSGRFNNIVHILSGDTVFDKCNYAAWSGRLYYGKCKMV
jgi:hypothetical protein